MAAAAAGLHVRGQAACYVFDGPAQADWWLRGHPPPPVVLSPQAACAEVTPRRLRELLTFSADWGPSEWGPVPYLPDPGAPDGSAGGPAGVAGGAPAATRLYVIH